MDKLELRVIAPEENAEVQKRARQEKIELAAMLVPADRKFRWKMLSTSSP